MMTLSLPASSDILFQEKNARVKQPFMMRFMALLIRFISAAFRSLCVFHAKKAFCIICLSTNAIWFANARLLCSIVSCTFPAIPDSVFSDSYANLAARSSANPMEWGDTPNLKKCPLTQPSIVIPVILFYTTHRSVHHVFLIIIMKMN